jgi:hypothetical protein
MKKTALRYILLRMAQSDDLVDRRMIEADPEYKDQAKGLFKEFCSSNEVRNSNILLGMRSLIARKRSYIPIG